MALPGFGVGKKEVRQFCNDLDKKVRDIQLTCQAELDKVGVKIDSELESCGRELTSASKTLNDIKPIIERVRKQMPQNTPADVRLFLDSAMSEILNKVDTVLDNNAMVQKNIKDVDRLTDEMDNLTDAISKIVEEVDALTDKYQV